MPEGVTSLIESGALLVLAWRLVPLLRLVAQLQIDMRRRVRRLEAVIVPPGKEPHGEPEPDDLERAAERAAGNLPGA